jgi:hypothetical protein
MQSPVAMPRDLPATTVAHPVWLEPPLLRALAEGIAADVAAGRLRDAALRSATERARALRPSLPATYVAEAVALAAWLAEAP